MLDVFLRPLIGHGHIRHVHIPPQLTVTTAIPFLMSKSREASEPPDEDVPDAQFPATAPQTASSQPLSQPVNRARTDRAVAGPSLLDHHRDARSPAPTIDSVSDATPVPLAREQSTEHLSSLSSPSSSTTTSVPPPSLSLTPMSDMPPPTFDPTDFYAPLLRCPVCPQPSLLVSPTTLHCGHTVCSVHVRDNRSSAETGAAASASSSRLPLPLPRSRTATDSSASSPSPAPVIPTCPLPTCRPVPQQLFLAPNIPPGSNVRYYPPPISPIAAGAVEPTARVTVPDPRIDVSVSRVLDLLGKAKDWRVGEEERTAEATNSEESSTDDDDERAPDPRGNHSVPSGSSSGPSESRRRGGRPRKRRHIEKPERIGFDSSEQLEDHFNKELTESLTCEICFMLLFQPVTTPCQHVCVIFIHCSLLINL